MVIPLPTASPFVAFAKGRRRWRFRWRHRHRRAIPFGRRQGPTAGLLKRVLLQPLAPELVGPQAAPCYASRERRPGFWLHSPRQSQPRGVAAIWPCAPSPVARRETPRACAMPPPCRRVVGSRHCGLGCRTMRRAPLRRSLRRGPTEDGRARRHAHTAMSLSSRGGRIGLAQHSRSSRRESQR